MFSGGGGGCCEDEEEEEWWREETVWRIINQVQLKRRERKVNKQNRNQGKNSKKRRRNNKKRKRGQGNKFEEMVPFRDRVNCDEETLFKHLIPKKRMKSTFVDFSSIDDLPNPYPSLPSKYWHQRYRYFSRFDEGVVLDEESFYSITPESLALHMARRVGNKGCLGIDWFNGCGGNAIQMASRREEVGFMIGCDIDVGKLRMSKKNAEVYNVDLNIDFVLCDSTNNLSCFRTSTTTKQPTFDISILSPPWGGVSYFGGGKFRLEEDIKFENGWNGIDLWKQRAVGKTINIYLLPRNCNLFDYFYIKNDSSVCGIKKDQNIVKDRYFDGESSRTFNSQNDPTQNKEEEEEEEINTTNESKFSSSLNNKMPAEEVEYLFLRSNLKMKVVYSGNGIQKLKDIYKR